LVRLEAASLPSWQLRKFIRKNGGAEHEKNHEASDYKTLDFERYTNLGFGTFGW
tara:strand:+ start:568 stop:729 length:162 start_codon:yes stop_codon:yes gene_type:complete